MAPPANADDFGVGRSLRTPAILSLPRHSVNTYAYEVSKLLLSNKLIYRQTMRM
jgi:hypothetical protein